MDKACAHKFISYRRNWKCFKCGLEVTPNELSNYLQGKTKQIEPVTNTGCNPSRKPYE